MLNDKLNNVEKEIEELVLREGKCERKCEKKGKSSVKEFEVCVTLLFFM
jgi:hypothetical protein